MDGEFVGEVAPLGYLDGVNLSNQVGNGYVGSSELLGVSLFAQDPPYGNVVSILRDGALALCADGCEWVAIDLTAVHCGDRFVEQVHHVANEPGFCLSALAEQDYVLSGQNGVFELRDDGLIESDDPREQYIVVSYPGYQVFAHLLLDRKYLVAGLSQLSNILWATVRCHVGVRSCVQSSDGSAFRDSLAHRHGIGN